MPGARDVCTAALPSRSTSRVPGGVQRFVNQAAKALLLFFLAPVLIYVRLSVAAVGFQRTFRMLKFVSDWLPEHGRDRAPGAVMVAITEVVLKFRWLSGSCVPQSLAMWFLARTFGQQRGEIVTGIFRDDDGRLHGHCWVDFPTYRFDSSPDVPCTRVFVLR